MSTSKIQGARPTAQRMTPRLFIRQVIDELRKVVTPTRKELVTYVGIVLAFVVVMTALVLGIDYVFGGLMLSIFGGAR